MDASARQAFNMKVLKRHDPAIEDIIESASYVVLYTHDGEWTKSGIEGPMFLYKRSKYPPYGFFVLNRNGVENYSAHLTLEDDLEITSDFIIYGASKGDGVVGIWIFEPTQRESVGQQMAKLQQAPMSDNIHAPVITESSPTVVQPAATSQQSASISLDALFGTSSPSSAQSTAPARSGQEATNGLSLLDSIFNSTSPPSKATTHGTDGLKAMLGLHGASLDLPSAPMAVIEPAPPQSSSPPAATSVSNLDAIFNSVKPKSSIKVTQNQSNGSNEHTVASAVDIVDASIQQRAAKGNAFCPSLSRTDFVREVLSLIHTEKDFVDDLYQRYLAQQ